MKNNSAEKLIVLFDGTCGFCKSCVNFVLRHSEKNKFLFLHLQSSDATELLTSFGFPENYSDSVVLIENKKVFLKSTAALHILRKLKWTMSWLYIFIIIPPVFRDKVYDWVAANRSKIKLNNESCAVPEKKV